MVFVIISNISSKRFCRYLNFMPFYILSKLAMHDTCSLALRFQASKPHLAFQWVLSVSLSLLIINADGLPRYVSGWQSTNKRTALLDPDIHSHVDYLDKFYLPTLSTIFFNQAQSKLEKTQREEEIRNTSITKWLEDLLMHQRTTSIVKWWEKTRCQ